jgi:hypothetical protein
LVFGALCATFAACSGAAPPSAPRDAAEVSTRATQAANVVQNPGFENGLYGWTECARLAVSLSNVAHGGKKSVLLGTTRKPAIGGVAAICQTVIVPASAHLSFWTKSVADVSVDGEYQQAQLLDKKKVVQIFYTTAATTKSWKKRSYDLSDYAGRSLTLEFDVRGKGKRGDDIGQFVDDVTLAGVVATPTPSPSPAPTASPTPATSPTPTPLPTATPTPAATPLATPPPCNDAQFVTYQSEFGSHAISGDQFVNVCGNVTQVLSSQSTSSGLHGYFDVEIAGANPAAIEIVSNLDAMAEAPSNTPPSWPWVSVGDYVYVQGRYYFDNTNSQGIDWTEDDSSGSWPHTGYVAVCSSVGTGCYLYQ